MRVVSRARQVLTGRLIQFTFESNRAAALLAFGAGTTMVAATFAAIASTATTPTPTPVSAFATARVFAARGEATFAAGFAGLLAGSTVFTAKTAALTAGATRATSAAATMTPLTVVTVAASLTAGTVSGARAGGRRRSFVASEQALEPAHETAGLFRRHRSRLLGARVTGRAGFEFAFFATIARVPGLPRFALVARVAGLTGLAWVTWVARGALITGWLAWTATFRIFGAFTALAGGLKRGAIRAVDGLVAGVRRGRFPMHAWPLGLGRRENVEFRLARDFGFDDFRGGRGFVAQGR